VKTNFVLVEERGKCLAKDEETFWEQIRLDSHHFHTFQDGFWTVPGAENKLNKQQV